MGPEDEAFLADVLDDFRENRDYASFESITVNETLAIPTLIRRLERIDQEREIGLLIVDHSELLQCPKKRCSNRTEEVNAIYDALRNLSLQFKGKGLAILALHQVNREGKKEAMKTHGVYTHTGAISYGNEVERSSTVITWSYLDDGLRADSKCRMGTLKVRSGPPVQPFEVDIDWGNKRMTYPSAALAERAMELTRDLGAVVVANDLEDILDAI